LFVFAAILSIVVSLFGLHLALNLYPALLFGAMIGFGFVYYTIIPLLLVLLFILILAGKKYKPWAGGGFILLLVAAFSSYFNYLLFAVVLFPIYFGFGSFYYKKPQYFRLYSALLMISTVFLAVLVRAVL